MDNTELNRAIAERVMGLRVEDRDCYYFHDSGHYEEWDGCDKNDNYKRLPCVEVYESVWRLLPDYSGDIAAAFIAVEQMAVLDWAFTLNSTSSVLGREYLVWFTRLIKPSATGFAKEATAALAVCAAALDALSCLDNSELQSNSDEVSGE